MRPAPLSIHRWLFQVRRDLFPRLGAGVNRSQGRGDARAGRLRDQGDRDADQNQQGSAANGIAGEAWRRDNAFQAGHPFAQDVDADEHQPKAAQSLEAPVMTTMPSRKKPRPPIAKRVPDMVVLIDAAQRNDRALPRADVESTDAAAARKLTRAYDSCWSDQTDARRRRRWATGVALYNIGDVFSDIQGCNTAAKSWTSRARTSRVTTAEIARRPVAGSLW